MPNKVFVEPGSDAFVTEERVFSPMRLQVLYRCPNQDCLSIFIADYHYQSQFGKAVLTRLRPKEAIAIDFAETIQSLSPSFCEIFSQARWAEESDLNQVCGVGYRKALEFLIKDYAIALSPTDMESIKQTPVAACIKKYIDDPRIKKRAELATWLGNDETHYEGRWIDLDLEDVKRLIQLTVHWIEIARLTDKYESEMKN